MKCRDCAFKETIEGVNEIRCTLTGEERYQGLECNCERVRVRRENEARLLTEKENAVAALNKLKERVVKPFPDLMYIYNGLHQIRAEINSTKLEELIQYLEGYL